MSKELTAQAPAPVEAEPGAWLRIRMERGQGK